VDHASSFVYVTFHSSEAAAELVCWKAEFEQFSARFNVQIWNIRADNGVYSAQLFRISCLWHQQHLTFCGVGAHWQNGIAECFIGTVTQQARTILLHAIATQCKNSKPKPHMNSSPGRFLPGPYQTFEFLAPQLMSCTRRYRMVHPMAGASQGHGLVCTSGSLIVTQVPFH
jgi:hypothetical protein